MTDKETAMDDRLLIVCVNPDTGRVIGVTTHPPMLPESAWDTIFVGWHKEAHDD